MTTCLAIKNANRLIFREVECQLLWHVTPLVSVDQIKLVGSPKLICYDAVISSPQVFWAELWTCAWGISVVCCYSLREYWVQNGIGTRIMSKLDYQIASTHQLPGSFRRYEALKG